jgi:hypothetical protein
MKNARQRLAMMEIALTLPQHQQAVVDSWIRCLGLGADSQKARFDFNLDEKC